MWVNEAERKGYILAVYQNLKRSRREYSAMSDEPVWETISTAPYERDLELSVIEADHVHRLVFACRRVPDGWVKVATRERIFVNPTHWRPWQRG
jgi:hypothetical protein